MDRRRSEGRRSGGADRAGGRRGLGRGVGREGAAAAPSPRPGAEQREAAQAAAGPAAARRPCEAPDETPGQLSLGLGSWERPGEAPRLLTWGEDSRDPGGPGRTAEMPQTDTAAILETVSSDWGEGRPGGGTAAGGGERREGTAAWGGSWNSLRGREGRSRGAREEGRPVAGRAGLSPAGAGGRGGRGGGRAAGRVTWGGYKRPKPDWERELAGLEANSWGRPSSYHPVLRSGGWRGQKRKVHPDDITRETWGPALGWGGFGASPKPVARWLGGPRARGVCFQSRALALARAFTASVSVVR